MFSADYDRNFVKEMAKYCSFIKKKYNIDVKVSDVLKNVFTKIHKYKESIILSITHTMIPVINVLDAFFNYVKLLVKEIDGNKIKK